MGYTDNVGFFNPEATPNSDMLGPLLLYIIPVPILDLGRDLSWGDGGTWGKEEGAGTGFGRVLELFSREEGVVMDEGTEWVLFLDPKVWVWGVTGVDIELPFTGRELGKFPNELDLSIDELVASFNGLGPLDMGCIMGGRSITPNSDVLGTFLSDGLAFSVRGPCVDGREGWGRRVGRDRVVDGSLGGNGGGSTSSPSCVGGNRAPGDGVVLRTLLLREDCLVQVPSADIVLCALEREGPVAYCDLREANEDVRERAIDESRRVSGEGESSSSLYARNSQHRGEGGWTQVGSHTYRSIPTPW